MKPFVVTLCDPGPEYYDMLGVDMYNQAKYYFTAAGQWIPVQAFAASVGRPFLSAETGIAGTDTKVVPYLQGDGRPVQGLGCRKGRRAGAGRVLDEPSRTEPEEQRLSPRRDTRTAGPVHDDGQRPVL